MKGGTPSQWMSYPEPRLQKMIEERTGGRLVIDTKMDLFPMGENIFAVIEGRVDMATQFLSWGGCSGTYPQWDIGALPFFWGNYWEYERAINDPRMLEIFDRMYADAGVVRLFEPIGGRLDAIWGNKPVPTVDSFKGLKIRSTGLLPTLTLQLLGAAPLAMPGGEIAEALKRGTVDAVFSSVSYGAVTGMPDVTEYISSPWALQPIFSEAQVINIDSWNALPADLKDILRQVGREMQDQVFLAAYSHDELSRIMAATMMKVVKPEKAEIDKARELAKPAIDKWLEIAGSYGPEILAVCADYASGAEIMLKK